MSKDSAGGTSRSANGRPRVVLTANATSNVGGQGLNLRHMEDAYASAADLSVFCRGAGSGERRTFVPPPKTKRAESLPVLRRFVDWWTLASDLQFDGYVAARLPDADLVQCAVGQGLFTLREAKKRKIPTVLDVVNTHVDDFADHVNRECAHFKMRAFLHPMMRSRILREYEVADAIRVMSHAARRTFLERGVAPDKVFVATPPADFGESAGVAANEAPDGVFRVGFVGLVVPWKGFHYLVDAFTEVDRPSSELVLWGGTSSRGVRDWLAKQMRRDARIKLRPESVRSAGFAEAYGKMSVLVHPSLADGFAYVVAEAMSCGVPVIVTSNTGAADLVVDGENGFIVPPGDAGAIAARLRTLAADPERRRRMGAAARGAVAALTEERFRSQLLTPALALVARGR